MNQNIKSKSGFTIIEVVLVLAIAGLIFLIVFLAVPALQRSQRDTQRKQDLSRLVAAVQSYQSNNRGAIPVTATAPVSGFVSSYLTKDSAFDDPSGGTYTLDPASTTPTTVSTPTDGSIVYVIGRDCANGAVGSKKVAFVVGLEGGGVACQTN